MLNNFEISLVVFMPNITTNHAITYTNYTPLLLFLTVSTRAVIGQFCGPYFTVRAAAIVSFPFPRA